jgi:hypothetical protein
VSLEPVLQCERTYNSSRLTMNSSILCPVGPSFQILNISEPVELRWGQSCNVSVLTTQLTTASCIPVSRCQPIAAHKALRGGVGTGTATATGQLSNARRTEFSVINTLQQDQQTYQVFQRFIPR